MNKPNSGASSLQASDPAPRRRGYVRLSDIPPELVQRLNRGEIETATLTEQTAMDFACLLGTLDGWCGDARGLADDAGRSELAAHGLVRRMALAGQLLGRYGAFKDAPALRQLMGHASDTVRGFACFAIAQHPDLGFDEKLAWIRPLAADPHFGVREWAWLALRPGVAVAPFEAIALLQPWVGEADASLRRFAIEITRPRGVWARRIVPLLSEPWHGLPLLTACCCDDSRYVQDSVANWLNDAAKSRPDWVGQVCAGWLKSHPDSQACRYVARRGQRSLPGRINQP